MNRNGNIILSSLTEAEKQTKVISETPAGYLTVNLSTKGKVGAPAVVHVRNFKVSEILALSMSDDTELPIRLVNILNDCILEDVDVANWHEKEVEELMVYIFMTFYKGTLEDLPFPYTQEDLDFLKAQENGEQKVRDIEEGKWVPRTSVDIASSLDTYDVSDNFTPRVTITNKKTGFHVTFDYIKYGDQIVIKRWLDSFFAEDEKRFSTIRKQIEFNNGISNQILSNPDNIDKLIPIDAEEERCYKEYLLKRTQAITDIAHIISIVNFDGEDVSHLSVGEKYDRFVNEALIDYNLIMKLSKRQLKMQFGIKPEVSMKNPITGEVVKRPLSFRIPLILSALQVSRDDDYDDGFDDED